MGEPITDSESISDTEQSFEPTVSATIVHHNGTAEVSGFDQITEIDIAEGTIRVWYSEDEYEDYHGATITEVSP